MQTKWGLTGYSPGLRRINGEYEWDSRSRCSLLREVVGNARLPEQEVRQAVAASEGESSSRSGEPKA
jgi:hypothetical protein